MGKKRSRTEQRARRRWSASPLIRSYSPVAVTTSGQSSLKGKRLILAHGFREFHQGKEDMVEQFVAVGEYIWQRLFECLSYQPSLVEVCSLSSGTKVSRPVSGSLDRVEVRVPLGKPAIQSSGQALRLWATVVLWGQVCSPWICLGLRSRESGNSGTAAALLPRHLTPQLVCVVPEAPRGGFLSEAEWSCAQ